MGEEGEHGVRRRWMDPGSGRVYDDERWSHAGRRARDPAVVRRILERLGPSGRVLDAPCGTGRLHGVLAEGRSYVGVDVSVSMLTAAAGDPERRLLRADAARLPFRDGSFEAVVCCRLLHHLGSASLLQRVLDELVRVSCTWVIGSFWDARTLETLRRRLPLARRPRSRVARSRGELAAALGSAGAEVRHWHSWAPLVSQQCWFVAKKHRSAAGNGGP